METLGQYSLILLLATPHRVLLELELLQGCVSRDEWQNESHQGYVSVDVEDCISLGTRLIEFITERIDAICIEDSGI